MSTAKTDVVIASVTDLKNRRRYELSSDWISAIRSRFEPAGIVVNGSSSSTHETPTTQAPHRGTLAPATTPIRRAVRITAMIQNGIESLAPRTSSCTSLARKLRQMSKLNDVSSPFSSASALVAANVRRPVEYAKTYQSGAKKKTTRIRIAGASISHVEPVSLRLRERRRVAGDRGGPLLSLGCQVAPPLARRWSPLTAWGRAREPAPTRDA